MQRALIVLSSVVMFASVSLARAEDVSIANVPPVVVRTVPLAGADDVDPAVTEIKVTFSKDMQDKNWSWTQRSEATFPQTTGEPKYVDPRNCVLPVKLEPNKTYWILLNSDKFKNFKDSANNPALPYLLVFKTKAQ